MRNESCRATKIALLCRYQFHPKSSPPGHDLKGAKPSPRDNHSVQKSSPRDNTGSQKPQPREITSENFTMYLQTLTQFETKSFVVSTNKTVSQ